MTPASSSTDERHGDAAGRRACPRRRRPPRAGSSSRRGTRRRRCRRRWRRGRPRGPSLSSAWSPGESSVPLTIVRCRCRRRPGRRRSAKAWSGLPSTSTLTGTPCWRETVATPSTFSIWSPYCAGKPWKVGSCTRKSLVNWSSTIVVLGGAQRRGEHADRRDDGEADHQRRGGGARTPRVAQGVLAGEAPGGAEEPAEDGAARSSTGLPSTGREDRGRHHPDDRADTDPDRVGAGGADEARDGQRRCRRPSRWCRAPSRRPMPFSCTTRSSRIAATGGTLAARRAGTKRGDHRDDDAHDVAGQRP